MMVEPKLLFQAKFDRRRFVLLMLGSVLLWAIASVALFFLSYLFHWGLSRQSLGEAELIWQDFLHNPLYVFKLYGSWFDVLQQAILTSRVSWVLWLPLLPLLLLIVAWGIIFKRTNFWFHLWYRLHHRLATAEDIAAMGLFDGHLMNLGRFDDKVLRLNKPYSVFCFGTSGVGKTAGVVLPSVLESDAYSIIAVDNNGGLARYSSGYRETLGPVYYFNWALEDNPAQGEYWPRWNPLSFANMPPRGDERDDYLAFIARYLIHAQTAQTENPYWDKLAALALEGLLQFFVCKISQAQANDYFLGLFMEKSRLSNEDKALLLSYYADMPESYGAEAIKNLEQNKLTHENYLPVGSWDGIPEAWQGKELCLAMFVDFLLRRYFELSTEAKNRDIGGWKIVLESLSAEAELFAYSQKARAVLRQISYLSRKQRSIIFPMMLKPLSMFRSGSLRERTSSSDFYSKDVFGVVNAEGKKVPVTVYIVAAGKKTKFVSRFMIDVLLYLQLKKEPQKGECPLLYVFDDLAEIPPFENLGAGLRNGAKKNMSFLLAGNDFSHLQKIYGRENLEEIVSNTAYKLAIGENGAQVAQNISRLAEFATKSVQIPQTTVGSFARVQNVVGDAGYYLKLAQRLNAKYRYGSVKKGWHLLLSEGYYHLPIKLKTDYFYNNPLLQEKALIDAAYPLAKDVWERRNPQDKEVPDVMQVLEGCGTVLESEEDIDRRLNDYYEEAMETMQELPSTTEVMADDISIRWKANETEEAHNENADDWWMREDGFTDKGGVNENPFEKK